MCLINVSWFFKFIIIIGWAGSLPCTGFLVVVNGGFSLWWLFLLWSTGSRCSVVAACMFSSCGSWALRNGLSSQVHGFSCSVACGIFPDQGLNPCPLHWQADSLLLDHQGSPCKILINAFSGIIISLLHLPFSK